MSRLKTKAEKDQLGLRILLGCAGMVVLLVIAQKAAVKPEPCSGKVFQVSVVIDDTDSLNQEILGRIDQDIRSLLKRNADTDTKLNFFKVSGASTPGDAPDYVCVPKNCGSLEGFVSGCKAQRTAMKKFEESLKKVLEEAGAHKSEISPIAETLVNIPAGLFLNSETAPHSRLLIYSDMLQNSKCSSFYQGAHTLNYQCLPHAKFNTDDIEVCVIQRPESLQIQKDILSTWQIFFGRDPKWHQCPLVVSKL